METEKERGSLMWLPNWIASNVQYGRDLANSGLEGAGRGREEFLQGQPLAPFLGKAAARALKHAATGVCLGVLVGSMSRKPRLSRALAWGTLGGAIGFGAALSWRTHSLAASMGRGALKNVNRVRDQRWLEKNPIDYA